MRPFLLALALVTLTACSAAAPPPAPAAVAEQVVEGRTVAVGGEIVVKVGSETRTYPLAKGAELLRNGLRLPWTALRGNLDVRLTIRDGQIVRFEDLSQTRGDLPDPVKDRVVAKAEGRFAGDGRKLVAEVTTRELTYPGQWSEVMALRVSEPGGKIIDWQPIHGNKVKALTAVDFAGDGRPYIVAETISEAMSDHTANAYVFRLDGQQLDETGVYRGWWGITELVQEQGRPLIHLWYFFTPEYSSAYVPADLTCKPCPKLRKKEWIGYADGKLKDVRTEVSRQAYKVLGAKINEPPLPAEVLKLHDAGLRHLAAGKPAEAVAPLRQAVRQVPDFTDAWNELAFALAQTGQWADSRKAAAEAVRLNPWHAYAQYNLGLALLELKQPKEAENPLRAATALQVDRWEPHYALGRSYEGQGKAREALAEYREALKWAPDQAEVQAAIRRLGN